MLRGEERLTLRRDTKPAKVKKSDARALAFSSNAEARLWESLRARRKAIATVQGVPPYVVFHDATLMEMVQHRPRTREQLAEISGVGRRKLEAYGADFLEVILDHEYEQPEPLVNNNATETP